MSAPQPRDAAGFTLIELMIAVAIIGVLAAIAIPNFIQFQLRTKAGESKVNLAALRTDQTSFFAETGMYVQFPTTPALVPGTAKVDWPGGCSIPPNPADPGYCMLGFSPEGQVYYQYEATTNGAVTMSGNRYFAAALANIDGDANLNIWGISVPDLAGNAQAAGPLGCNTVINPVTGAAMLGQVGPCNDPAMGRTVF